MSNQAYTITDPTGHVYENILNLNEFCKLYNEKVQDDNDMLNYDNVRRSCRQNKEYKGWKFEKGKANSKAKKGKVELYGLTSDEKVIQLQDENHRLKTEIKNNQRESSIFKMLAEVIEQRPSFDYIPKLNIKSQKGKIVESACIILSDLHSDQTIKSERVNNLEEYNFNSFCRRAERLVETTIKHLTENLQGYSFETLYIFSLGDNIAGLIHNAQQHTEWQNVLKSSMACGDVIAKMIVDLSVYFKKIVYVGISGNHPRLDIGKKDFRGAHLNFDYLVNATAKSKCQNLIDNGRLDFVIPDSWSTMVKIYDYNFHLSHGDTLTGCSLGIPFYALQRRSYRLTSLGAIDGVVPHYQIIGHYHTQSSMSQTVGQLIVNGAFPACDEFSLQGLSLYNEPTQLLFGVHPHYGISWRMPVVLRDKNWRTQEMIVSRYNKDIF